MSAPRRVTLITGASEGIGLEFARVFASRGHDLALVARRAGRLEELADEIAAAGRPRPIVAPCDLEPADAPARLADALDRAGAGVDILVNNAGFGLNGAFGDLSRAAQLAMVDLNVRALAELTHLFLPQLRAARGGVLNVASIAGLAPGPGMAVYYATKAFVLSFSEALHEELRAEGVRVTALCPGPVATGFQARAGIAERMDRNPAAISARAAAEAGYAGLAAGRRVVTPGAVNKGLAAALAWMPRRLLLPRLAARQMARGPKGLKSTHS